MRDFVAASFAIVLHVANYNSTAQIEHKTRVFTKLLGKNAVYYYAVYLVLSALVRDHFIQIALQSSQNTLEFHAPLIGRFLFGFGVFLNIWTLNALGIKGMYNGDSFGHLMDAPVSDGPYRFLSEPQYVGTSMCLLGSALHFRSLDGLYLTGIMFAVFMFSVKFIEGPHMIHLYSKKKK
jgi:phosphatidylethanolamine/phosphatidyl-N-methylethanolamine N-methyltransferase